MRCRDDFFGEGFYGRTRPSLRMGRHLRRLGGLGSGTVDALTAFAHRWGDLLKFTVSLGTGIRMVRGMKGKRS